MEFTKIRKHFFRDFNKKLRLVKDVRHTSYITYEPDILLFTVIMKNVSGIFSMNKMTRDFNTEESINNIAKSLEIDSLSDINFTKGGDKIKDLLRKKLIKIFRKL